jgi:hypothetical protein
MSTVFLSLLTGLRRLCSIALTVFHFATGTGREAPLKKKQHLMGLSAGIAIMLILLLIFLLRQCGPGTGIKSPGDTGSGGDAAHDMSSGAPLSEDDKTAPAAGKKPSRERERRAGRKSAALKNGKPAAERSPSILKRDSAEEEIPRAVNERKSTVNPDNAKNPVKQPEKTSDGTGGVNSRIRIITQ